MRSIKNWLTCLIVTITFSISFGYVIDNEFTNPLNPADTVYVKWASAGSNAVIDSIFTINVSAIPDSVSYVLNGVVTPIPSATPNDEIDDSFSFRKLIIWMEDNITIHGIHAQIYIPAGTYNFSDQIIMHSNISLKGAGSHLTELRFLIRADSTSSTMSKADCRKDAILISGTDDAFRYNCGIEDLKIERIRDGISEGDVKDKVEGYDTNGVQGGKLSYWGNNIAIRRATNC